MGRPPRYDNDAILDTVIRLVARDGAAGATATAVAAELGAPSGSIYHRFPSRDLLVARAWLRTVKRFQQGFATVLSGDDAVAAADSAALYTPRFCRAHLDEARILLLHRRADLTAAWPDDLGVEVQTLAGELDAQLRGFCRRRLGACRRADLDRVVYALVDIPYAAVRRFLADGCPPPTSRDALILTASRAVLAGR